VSDRDQCQRGGRESRESRLERIARSYLEIEKLKLKILKNQCETLTTRLSQSHQEKRKQSQVVSSLAAQFFYDNAGESENAGSSVLRKSADNPPHLDKAYER